MLLLLNLACYQVHEAKLNPYKDSLSKFQNSQGNLVVIFDLPWLYISAKFEMWIELLTEKLDFANAVTSF